MTRQISERIVAVLIVLFLLAYVGYQAQRFFSRPIDTVTAYEYTVSRSISARGIAVREEGMLEQATTGMEYYPLEDASRVAIGQAVAELYRGQLGDKSVKRVRELEDELRLLQEAQNTPVDYANTEVYNRDVKTKLGQISAMSSEGRYTELAETRRGITSNINKKQISNSKAESFTLRIGQIQDELERLNFSAVSEGAAVTAPVAGYFSRSVDGYEALLTPSGLNGRSLSDLLGLIEGKTPISGPARVGKMVLSEKWVFAAAIPSYHLEWIKPGQQVRLQLEQISHSVPATVTEILDEKGADTAVLLLGCNQMSEDLINLRVSGAVLHFQQYTGIRINAADLRFRINGEGISERGIYTLRGGQVYFRLVDPIYEEPGFVLSKTYYAADEYLEPQRQARRQQAAEAIEEPEPPDLSIEEEQAAQEAGTETPVEDYKRYVILFDQVITKGIDLYDGKMLQEY